MARVQVALNVEDLGAAISFYSQLFDCEPAKIRPGYANFSISNPPLKLVLIEGSAVPGSINHLGVEVASTNEVSAATARFASLAMASVVEEQTTCCYAVQNKVWVHGPDGSRWEIYTVLADADTAAGIAGDQGCCGSPATPPLTPVNTDACC